MKRMFGWWVAFALVFLLPGVTLGATEPPTITPFKTARVQIEGTLSAQGRVQSLQGVGQIDAANGASHLTIAALGAAFETIVVDGRTYSRNPLNGRWEVAEGAQLAGFSPARLAPYDPETIRAAGRNFTQVGSETINGIATTRWRADTDLALLLGSGSPAASGAGTGQTAATMDLWIGNDDQRLHRLALTAVGAGAPGLPASGAPIWQTLTLTFDLFDTDVRIIAPPEAVPATPATAASPVAATPATPRAATPNAPAASPSPTYRRGSSPRSILIVRLLGIFSLLTVGTAIWLAQRHRLDHAQRSGTYEEESRARESDDPS